MDSPVKMKVNRFVDVATFRVTWPNRFWCVESHITVETGEE